MNEETKNVTLCENSANDTYLILEKATGKCLNIGEDNRCRLAYRRNLPEVLSSIFSEDGITEFTVRDMNDSLVFRKMIKIADEKGYSIYQLTRL